MYKRLKHVVEFRIGFGAFGGYGAGAYAPDPGGSSEYDIAAEIATIRARSTYGSWFTSTANPLAPNGLQLPTAPTLTSSATVSSIADLLTNLVSGRHVTLSPGTYTVASTISISGLTDFRLTMTGCTLNGPVTSKTLTVVGRTCSRIRIVDGTINGGAEFAGTDVHVFGTHLNGSGSAISGADESNNSGSTVGHRVCYEKMVVRDYSNGFWFTGRHHAALFVGAIAATTLTVSVVYDGSPITEGQKLINVTSGSIAVGTKIVQQLTGTPGGAGTYEVNISQTVSAGNIFTADRSTNLILANCDIEVPDKPVGAAYNPENPSRFNGVDQGVIMDCRLWCEDKFTLRAHADYSLGADGVTGAVGWFNNQLERNGVTCEEPGASGIYPAVEHLVIDNWKRTTDGLSRPSDATTGGLLAVPRGTGGNTLVDVFHMAGFKSRSSAPGGSEGTAGTGVLPSGTGSPYAGWPTVADAATSLGSGNAYEAYSQPTWPGPF